MAKATGSENKDLLSGLEELATQARNSEQGYKQSAENVQDPDLRSTFSDLARERERQASELDEIIRRLGGTPPSREGSTAGAAHRMWVDLKSAITGGDRRSILQEVVRGESYAESMYDRILKRNLQGMTVPQDVVQTIQQLHVAVRNARNRFRSMLEAAGGAPETAGRMESMASGMEQYVIERPMMGTALALGVGLILGALLTMSMRAGTGDGGRSMDYRRGRQMGYRYGPEGRAGYGATGYGYGSSGQAGYGYGAGTRHQYGQGTESSRTNP